MRELLGATGEFSTDAKQGPILAQSWYVLEASAAPWRPREGK